MNSRYLILADESSAWRIGGLRQIERLLLALNEFLAKQNAGPASIQIWWRDESHRPSASIVGNRSLSHIASITEFRPEDATQFLLSTRLLVRRDTLENSPELLQVHLDPAESWSDNLRQLQVRATPLDVWLPDERAAALADRNFLRRAGKPQDGLVSRWLNRPISRAVSRRLLPFPITPNGWTCAILIFPLIATLLVARGGYLSILFGTLVYHLHSILDGCDGEIARAKYLESPRGKHIDDFCDISGALFFVVGLGVGLSRGGNYFYLDEGVICALLIATNEILLRLPSAQQTETPAAGLSDAYYPRHRQMIQNSGITVIGDKLVWLVVQATKRDVGILIFVLLALCGIAQWILHLWTGTTVLSFSLTLIALARRVPSKNL